jgi:putative MATE family efflux protein
MGVKLLKKNTNMLQGSLLKGIITYSIPLILTSWLQLLFNAADLVVVGNYRSSFSVAAVGATSSITNLIVNLFMGLSVGVSVATAHGLGSNDKDAVHRTVHTTLPLAVFCGLILTAIGVPLCGTFLRWMDTPETVLPLAARYMRIYFAGMTFNMVYNFASSILRAAGDTKSPLIFLAIAGVVNVCLNLLFVVVCHMDVEGVALATTASQALSAVLVVIALMRRTDACRLSLKKMRIYKPQLQKIMRIGLSAGFQSSMFSISNVLIQSSVNSFGDVFVAGNSAAQSIEGFVYVSFNSFMQAAVNFTGQNVGARQYGRVKKIFGTCVGCATVVGGSIGVVAYLLGPQLLSIYIKDSALSIEYGILRLGIICVPYFLCGLMEVATGVLRGLGKSISPTVICLLCACVFRVVWIYTVFKSYHTPESLFISYPISWIMAFTAQALVIFPTLNKLIKKAEGQ